jgi:protein-disulfide isomerase
MTKKRLLAASTVMAAVLSIAIWHARSSQAAGQTPGPAPARGRFTITPVDRTIGSNNARVVLIEYASPTCPHCAEFYTAYFPTLKTNFIDTGKVRFVYRIFILRPDDGAVEKLARCLPASQYFDFVEALFRNQAQWDGDIYPVDMQAGLLRMATAAGMNPQQAEKCMVDPALNTQLNQVSDLATRQYGVNGTPTFVVNGVPGEAGEQWPHLRQRLLAVIAAK